MDDYAKEVYVLKSSELLEQLNDLDMDLLISNLNAALVSSSVFYLTDKEGSKRYNQSKAFLFLFESLYPLLSDFALYSQKLEDGADLTDSEFDNFIVTMMNMVALIPKIKGLTLILACYAPDFVGSNLAKEKEEFLDYLDTMSQPAPIVINTFEGIVKGEFSDGFENACLIIPANLTEEVWQDIQLAQNEASKDKNNYLLYAPLAYELIEEDNYSDMAVVFLQALFNVLNYEKSIKEITYQQIADKSMEDLIEQFKLNTFYLDMLNDLEHSYAELSTVLPLDEINQVRGSSFQLKMQAKDGDLMFESILLEEENFYKLVHDLPQTEEFKRYKRKKQLLNSKLKDDLAPYSKKA